MRQTVVGLFDGPQAASAAMAELAAARIDPARIRAVEMPAPASASPEPQPEPEPGPPQGGAASEDGMLGHLRHFFAGMFDVDHDLTPYASAVRRGGRFVRLEVEADDQPQAVRAELALVRAGAVDITRRTPLAANRVRPGD